MGIDYNYTADAVMFGIMNEIIGGADQNMIAPCAGIVVNAAQNIQIKKSIKIAEIDDYGLASCFSKINSIPGKARQQIAGMVASSFSQNFKMNLNSITSGISIKICKNPNNKSVFPKII